MGAVLLGFLRKRENLGHLGLDQLSGALVNDHVNSIFRGYISRQGPNVSSGVSGAGEATHTPTNGEP